MTPNAPLPLDIKLMNGLAAILFGVLVLMLLGAGLAYLRQLPLFAIRGVTVVGDVSHYNAISLRANVMPRLKGTFLTLDLQATRQVFETMPWVRQAVVRRDFPNRLKVQLQEHQPVALWGSEGGQGDARLVNSFGEVFEANLGEIDQDSLPTLSGPEGEGPEVLAMYRVLEPMFSKLEMVVEQLKLSGRGSWSVRLEAGAEIELGRGNADEVTPRVERFLKTLTQVVSRYGRAPNAIESADLRHENGYAIRLRGVSTVVPDVAKK